MAPAPITGPCLHGAVPTLVLLPPTTLVVTAGCCLPTRYLRLHLRHSPLMPLSLRLKWLAHCFQLSLFSIGSTQRDRQALASNGSPKYCVSRTTLTPSNSMMLTV